MAANAPKERWITDLGDFPEQKDLPEGITREMYGGPLPSLTGTVPLYYALELTYPDGRVTTTWYKRGTGGKDENGQDLPDPPAIAPIESTNKATKDAYDKEQDERAKRPTKRYVGTDPDGRPAVVTEFEDGHKEYDAAATAVRPPTPSATTSGVSAPTDQPFIGRAGPDGTISWVPNPNSRPDTQKPTYITAGDGTVYEVVPGQQPRPIIQGAKPGQVVNVGGGRLVRIGPDGTAAVIYENPNEAPERIQDPETKEWLERDPTTGQWKPIARAPGSSGTETARVPRPALVIGQAAAALRAYGDQLDAEVRAGRMTAAQRTARWNEAMQMAPIAIDEANLAQNAEQANLNASVQLVNSRQSAATSGFNTALETVSRMNATLPKGSNLGGQAFLALLGMQMMHAQRMGAGPEQVRWPSSPEGRSLAGQGATGAGAHATTIGNVLARPPEPPAPVAPGPNALGLGAIGNVPAPGGPPDGPVAAPGGPPGGPVAAQALPPPIFSPQPPVRDDWRLPPPGQDPGFTLGAPPTPGAAPADVAPAGAMFAPRQGPLPSPAPPPEGATAVPLPSIAAPWNPNQAVPGGPVTEPWFPNQAAPGSPYVTEPWFPNQAVPGGPVTEGPVPGMSGSPPFNPPPGEPGHQPGQPVGMAGGDEPAVLMHAKAAGTPFWRMTEEDYRRYQAAGVPEEVIRSTGYGFG